MRFRRWMIWRHGWLNTGIYKIMGIYRHEIMIIENERIIIDTGINSVFIGFPYFYPASIRWF